MFKWLNVCILFYDAVVPLMLKNNVSVSYEQITTITSQSNFRQNKILRYKVQEKK